MQYNLKRQTHSIARFLARYRSFPRIERRTDQCQPYEDDELDHLAHSLVQRVPSEAHIMKCDLEPGTPQYTKEANVGNQVVAIGNGVVGREGSEVGYEEQVEEELDGVRFVSLGEDEVFMVGAIERVFDPGYGLVQAFEMLLLIPTDRNAALAPCPPRNICRLQDNLHISLVSVKRPTHYMKIRGNNPQGEKIFYANLAVR